MAAFCTSCGSPLGEGQVFCTKCGAKMGAPGSAPSAPAGAAPGAPLPPPAPMQAAPVAPAATVAPVAASSGSPVVKIILIVVGVLFLFGAIGVAGVVYVGYRIRTKAREMGLTNEHRHHSAALAGRTVDGCKFLTKDEVSAAVGMTVVRAEPTSGSDVGCSYSVMGDVAELTMKHAMQLNKEQTSAVSKQDQDKIQAMGKAVLQGSTHTDTSENEHPGEVVVLTLGLDENAAQFQMNLNKGVLGRLGSMTTKNLPDVGDEAFAAAGSMMFVRKNDTMVKFMYTQCPCGTDEIVPLAQKVAGAL
jgi:hypothetical protein